MKKIAHLLMGRLTIVGVSILLQICWLFLVLWKFSYQFTYANLIIRAAAIVLVLVIANKWENPANKLSWTFLILLSPILGIMLYFLFGRSGLTKHTREQMDAVNREVDACMPVDEEAVRLLQEADPSVLRQSKYIADWGHFPVYRNTATKYYESGEAMFPDMLAALESAEHFIFLEYFIIEEGHMFHQIEDILEKKVKEGVEVRLIYDDVGCIGTLPPRYYKQLQKKGIKCAAFNPFRPLLSVIMNNRDHRKIFVVDGAVGFTGGINLADEYINEVKRFGYWKDTGVRIEGEAVWSLTSMFLSMWNYIVHSTEDYSRFMPAQHQKAPFENDGFVQPYGDSPLDHENVGELVYMDMINNAKDYIYISTPYLIPDNEMLTALGYAAKSGVDVRIITPEIPDKWYVSVITRSFYRDLETLGVKVYEYKGGFNHAKMFLSDDKSAVVGTINLDYRSLYLHFECATYMYKTSCIKDIKADFDDMFENRCHRITHDDINNRSFWSRFMSVILRTIAPLL